jgi:MarR family transcriptional regulator, 2-MHQ and catechol-resistance regulon repressor
MGTHFKGSTEIMQALDAYIKLVRASESVTSRVVRHLDDDGLTVSQFGVLEALLHLGPLSQRELAQKILKSGGNVTMVVDNLEKRGLVTRERDEEDRRLYRITLTPAGRKLIKSIFPRHAGKIASQMNVLTKEELKNLGALCRKLGLQQAKGV